MFKNLFFFCLVPFITFGQTGQYELKTVLSYDHGSNFHCNEYRATAQFTNGSSQSIYDYNSLPRGNRTYTAAILYPATYQLNLIDFFGQRYTGSNCRRRQRENSDPNITISDSGCFEEGSRIIEDIYGNAMFGESVSISKRPLLTILPSDDSQLLPISDNVTLRSHTGFRSNEYNWEYSFNQTNWEPLTNFNGSSTISLNASDIFGNDAIDFHGQDIHIRQRACNYTSNTVTYKITASAPNIASVDKTDVKCYEGRDGVVKINFDRAIKDGEQLSIIVEDLNDQIGTENGLPLYETVSFTPDADNLEQLQQGNSFTLNGLPPGNFRVRLLGFLNGANTYTEGTNHSYDFTITEPSPVQFEVTKTDVSCHGGMDGEISIQASGGQRTGTYEYFIEKDGQVLYDWTPFTAVATNPFQIAVFETLTGFDPGDYTVSVRDANGCVAREPIRNSINQIIGLGDVKIVPVEITQPSTPVAIQFSTIADGGIQEPTAFGFNDGRITAKVNGGTKNTDGSYNFVWEYFNPISGRWMTLPVTDFDFQSDGEDRFIILPDARAGDYRLMVTDANYDEATDKTGCTIVNALFTLGQPEVLEVAVQQTRAISCNASNNFNDPFSDGELQATGSGGVALQPDVNNGLPYNYIWKKKDENGVYQIITGENSNILSGLADGEYAVNIIDANGITVGTAINNVVTPVDAFIELKEPDLLTIELTKTDVFCFNGSDGRIDATISGGTGDYTVNWDNGETIEDIAGLPQGTYVITVTDASQCTAQASITIDEPDAPLAISYTFFQPTFSGATNGWVEATVTGGSPLDSGAYTFNWENSSGANVGAQVTETISATSYTIRLNGIGADEYFLTIEDKNHPLAQDSNNCTIINSRFELLDPAPLEAFISLVTPISCNSSNVENDPFSNGVLQVIATGGVQLQEADNNGLPYYYTWKKETSPGVFEILTNQTTDIASGLGVGNYTVNIEDANGIILGVYQNNVLVEAQDIPYFLEEPPLLELSVEKQDVFCFRGSDGWARVTATGGTAPYTIAWSNGDTEEQTSELIAGIYEVTVTDSSGCQATSTIQITEPEEALTINYTAFSTPSTGGAADGWIEAQITGGTSFEDGSYTYVWTDESGAVLNADTAVSTVNNVFQIRLNNIKAGNYYLSIEDANYLEATTDEGCTATDSEFILYDPIEAIITVETPISCNSSNAFNDPYADGALQVRVTGGLPFETGEPYLYYWKKQNAAGIFEDMNQNTSIATNLNEGNYALNVEDSRGVIIGIYENLTLIEPSDEVFFFEEPELLEVTITATEVSCGAGDDATATAIAAGGIAPYQYAWSNGQTIPMATGLIAGNYVVFVTDARGCKTTGNVTINQPGGLVIDVVNQTPPTCSDGNDGRIQLSIAGGLEPYTYSWSTGENTTTALDGLSKGAYIFSLTDANGCRALREIVLEDPDALIIDLGPDVVLCRDQIYDLDGSIDDPDATYSWSGDNGFSSTSAQVSVNQAGTYQVTAVSAQGCITTDAIVITYRDVEIDAEFLLSSQAYVGQDVILFNVSSPLGETSEWVIPSDVTVIDRGTTSLTLRFPAAATYEIGLISTQGSCSELLYKNIVIEEESELPDPGDSDDPFITDFRLTPNPNPGAFQIYVSLSESSLIKVRVFDIQGDFIFKQEPVQMANEYTVPMNGNMASGVYFVVLETAKETQIKRMIVR